MKFAPGRLPNKKALREMSLPSGQSMTNYAKKTPLALDQSDNKGMSLLKKILLGGK